MCVLKFLKILHYGDFYSSFLSALSCILVTLFVHRRDTTIFLLRERIESRVAQAGLKIAV